MFNTAVIYLFFTTLLFGYLCGNIHGAFIIGKIFTKKDIRKYGSGNSGTTNALRVFGLKLAAPTFIIDISKALFPVLYAANIASWMLSFIGCDSINCFDEEINVILKVVMAIGCIFGHNYPFLLKFKGGKGIACTIGISFAINWIAGICVACSIALIILITRYVSLSSIITAILIPFLYYFMPIGYSGCGSFMNEKLLILGLVICVSAIYRHRSNIARLKAGTESKFGEKAKVN